LSYDFPMRRSTVFLALFPASQLAISLMTPGDPLPLQIAFARSGGTR
jgi:hypothetical protein